jgi:hypothetical protein
MVSNTTGIDNHLSRSVRNRNSTEKQISRASYVGDYVGVTNAAAIYLAVNTLLDVESIVSLTVPVANEFIALEEFLLEVRPS